MRAGWRTQRLGDLCEIVKGRKPKLKSTASDGDLPYLVAKVMRGSQEPEFASTSDRNSVMVSEDETIIICDGSNSGEVFTGFRGILSSTMGKLVKKADVDDAYLRAFLDSTFDVFNGSKTGAAIPHLDKEALYALSFSYPPLPEQRRIVTILDEAFEGIATAKANAEKNLQNVRELFDQHHQAVFAADGDDNVFKLLGDFASFRNGISYTKQSRGRTVPIIGVKDFQSHFWVPIDDLDSVTLDGDLSPADTVAEGDILTVRSNGNPELIGRCMVVGELTEPVTHSGFTIRIRINSTAALPTYVCQFLRSRAVRRALIDGGNGLNIKSLNQGMLADIVVPLPPVSKQHEVVGKIEAMSLETARLADVVSRKLYALDELRKSLLHQAFSGQL